jgi:C1A family cysteine protease
MPAGFRGLVRAPNKDHLIALSHQRHARRLRALAALAPPTAWDSRTKGIIGPVKDQAQCGSCWDFSGTGVVEVALYLAGVLKPDGSQALSEEYTLDCGNNGGCGGDDNVTVLDWAKKTGLPLASDYGPYQARAGRCAYKAGQKLYKIDDWGFADQSGGNGVTPTDEIKQAIMTYGCVGCAVAAGGDSFWDSGQGIGSGTSRSIDHDVILVGWDDSQGGGAWIMRNSWGTSWGTGGYAWIKYGAYQIGTEAVFALVKPQYGPLDPALWG